MSKVRRKLKLKQIQPPAMFTVLPDIKNSRKLDYWEISIRDCTDSFQSPIWFELKTRQTVTIKDIQKLAACECTNGEGFITVTHYMGGIPTEYVRNYCIYRGGFLYVRDC